MKRKKTRTIGTIFQELVLAICTIIMMLPIYYFVIGAFKERRDINQYPLVLTSEMFTLDNFPYVIEKMDYWRALGNTVTITLVSLLIVVAFRFSCRFLQLPESAAASLPVTMALWLH